MKKPASIVFIILLAIAAKAQTIIKITDRNTGEPIESVMALVSASTTKNTVFISDNSGNVAINIEPPFDLILSHINYHDQTLHITKRETIEVGLLPKSIVLDDIVVTGQYQPQSASNSVYSVKTINEFTIQSQGATQLSEVLSKQLNIRISPDVAIGSSSMSLQGIPGKNVKILVDGVPLINRNGNGNDADLSQINMANVERIEIVEGPMAVNYGANALAGVVNIITKKAENNAYRIGVDLQGESIADSYTVDHGISNANITSGFSLPGPFLLSINGGVYRFGGFHGEKEDREFLWNPKNQYFYDASLSYINDWLKLSYKFENFHEKIMDPDSLRTEIHQATGAMRPYGVDQEYKSSRISHQLQLDGKLSDFNRYNVVVSYSDFERKKRTFKNYLDTNEEVNYTASGSSDTTGYTAILSRGNFQNTNPNKFLNYQVGYELNLESTEGGRIKDGEVQTMNDYAAYASVELEPLKGLRLRPGVRGAYNSTFNGSIVPSVNIKYSLNPSIRFSAAYGRGYRAPSLRELYFEFVDSNHNIQGNEDLTPEYSNHFDVKATHRWSKSTIGVKSEVTLFYNLIDNLISLGFDENDPTFAEYFNLGRLQTAGFNLNETLMWGHLMLDLGFGLTGRREQEEGVDLPYEMFFTPEASVDFSYMERISQINISVFGKYNGATSRYFLDENNQTAIGTIEGYTLLDFTLSRRFFESTTLSIGAKNLLNTTTVSNSSATGGVHSGGSEASIGYGRSYFLKLAFNLNSNK